MLDTNEIYCMDCRDGLKLIPKNSIDLIVTDPPFAVNYNIKSQLLMEMDKSRQKQVDRDKDYIEFDIDYDSFAVELFRVLKENSHIYIFCGDKQLLKWVPALQKAGFKYGCYLIWLKSRQTLDLSFGYKYNYLTELCVFARKGNKKLNSCSYNNVLKYANSSEDLKHPCQKPIEMINFLIRNSSNPDDLVLDPFMGSGTTALSCVATQRNFIGFEVSEKYCDIAYDRLKQTTLLCYIKNEKFKSIRDLLWN